MLLFLPVLLYNVRLRPKEGLMGTERRVMLSFYITQHFPLLNKPPFTVPHYGENAVAKTSHEALCSFSHTVSVTSATSLAMV